MQPEPETTQLAETLRAAGAIPRPPPRRRSPADPPLPDRPSIAVLPFANLSGDPAQEYFADGIVEEIITALSRMRWLFVIARNSSFTYKGRAVDVKQVGRELGVRYVLEGSVRTAADRVRITGQLIDAGTGAHLWADRFDGKLEDIFESKLSARGGRRSASIRWARDRRRAAAPAVLEHVARAELAANLLHVHRATLCGEAGVARERGDNLLDDAVGECSCAESPPRLHGSDGPCGRRWLSAARSVRSC